MKTLTKMIGLAIVAWITAELIHAAYAKGLRDGRWFRLDVELEREVARLERLLEESLAEKMAEGDAG